MYEKTKAIYPQHGELEIKKIYKYDTHFMESVILSDTDNAALLNMILAPAEAYNPKGVNIHAQAKGLEKDIRAYLGLTILKREQAEARKQRETIIDLQDYLQHKTPEQATADKEQEEIEKARTAARKAEKSAEKRILKLYGTISKIAVVGELIAEYCGVIWGDDAARQKMVLS